MQIACPEHTAPGRAGTKSLFSILYQTALFWHPKSNKHRLIYQQEAACVLSFCLLI